jgi:hypothetical protein
MRPLYDMKSQFSTLELLSEAQKKVITGGKTIAEISKKREKIAPADVLTPIRYSERDCFGWDVSGVCARYF